MYVIYVCCNKVKYEARFLFEATIFKQYKTSKEPVSTDLILIKYNHVEDLNSLRIHLELQYQSSPVIWFGKNLADMNMKLVQMCKRE